MAGFDMVPEIEQTLKGLLSKLNSLDPDPDLLPVSSSGGVDIALGDLRQTLRTALEQAAVLRIRVET